MGDIDVDALLAGQRRALAKAITLIESSRSEDRAAAQTLLERVLAHTGQSIRVGISGIPGVGKSTFIESFGMELIRRGHRVAVLAVDPSSPVAGGSILGDKTRMETLSREEAAFIRPSPSQGALGGVALKTRDTILLCEAAGYDVILVETVGVGQDEVEIVGTADVSLVVLVPGLGDEVQALKAGIMEVADVVVINKSDQSGAERLEEDIKEALELRPMPPAGQAMWLPPIVRTIASEAKGISGCFDAIARHRSHLQQHQLLAMVQARRQGERFDELVLQYLRESLRADGVHRQSAETL